MFRHLGTLSRFIIRQDRIRISLWLIGILFFTFVVPIALDDLFASEAEQDVMAETMSNPAMIAMAGPADFDNYTLGVMTSHSMLIFTAIVVGLMSIFLMTRHTREEEETGRSELILALPVGRLAHLNASILVVGLANIAIALLSGFGLYALGLESMDLEGSLLYGANLGATGLFFTGVAAVFAQISVTARGATGLSIGFLLVCYLVRAVGDVSFEALSFFSPFGLVSRTEVYSNNVWWPIFLLIVAAFILILLANYFNAIRDWGSAFINEKAGKRHASRFLQSPLGLSFRIQRTSFISWAIGMLVLGMTYGSVMGDIEAFFEGNELLEQMLIAEEGYTLTEQFIPMLMLVMAILSSIPPIMAMTKLASEEKKNRTELLLAAPLQRKKLMGSYLLLALMNGLIMISLTAIGLWLAANRVMEDGFDFWTIYSSAIVYYPAILVMIGLTIFLIGFLPRFMSFIWFYFVMAFFINYLGKLFEFPEWVGYLSPYGHLPALPVESMDWLPIGYLTFIAVVLILLGFIGYVRRDISG